jgi:hypothetical protein
MTVIDEMSSEAMLQMCAMVKMQTLIRIAARTAVEYGIEKNKLMTALSNDYDVACNDARLGGGAKPN